MPFHAVRAARALRILAAVVAATLLPIGAPASAQQSCPEPDAGALLAENQRLLDERSEVSRRYRELECGKGRRIPLTAKARACDEVKAKFDALGTRLSAVGDEIHAMRQTAKSCAADLKDGRPRTAADFLPRGSNLYDQSCDALAGAAKKQLREDITRRIDAIPPNQRRSAITGGIERELSAEALVVAPEWVDLWKRKPVLQEWAAKYRCNTSLRFMVEFWQGTIGAPQNRFDASAIPRTLELIAKAEDDVRRFSGEQLRAIEAESQGEADRARDWALDTLSGATQRADAVAAMPTALCASNDAGIACTKGDPCSAEEGAVRAAAGKLNYVTLTRPLNDAFWAPPAELTGAVATAKDTLAICKRKSPFRAASKSRLLYAGIETPRAELRFGENGLATLRFPTPESNGEALRIALTDRFGLPETRTEERSELRTVPGVGMVPGVTLDGRAVMVQAPDETVRATYTVTRYTWRSAGALIEEVDGTAMFRFGKR